MTIQSALQAVEPHDPKDALLAEILSINSDLSDLQSRVSRLAQQIAARQVDVSFPDYLEGVLQAVADAIGLPEDLMRPTPGEANGSADTLEAAAADTEAGSYKPIPMKHYVPASPACRKVLDLYGETTITSAEIARQLDMNRSSVGSYLAMGRKANDPRVLKGDAARRSAAPAAKEPEELTAEDIVETVIVTVDEPSDPTPQQAQPEHVEAGLSSVRVFRRPPRVADEDEGPARLRIPSIPAPKPKFMPVAAAEAPQPKPTADFNPDKIMVVDVEALKIHGPWGSVDVVRPFARSMERMVDGGTYDVDTLRDLGPWPRTDALKDHFTAMRRKLAAIGIDLVAVNKFMFRVQRLEA
jgi:DNA-binding CsgD family transcriptional regulator